MSDDLFTGTPGWESRPGAATWDLAWCRPCKLAHPDEPVHEEIDCPRSPGDE